MSVVKLDKNGDWTFGQQKAGYISGQDEIKQNVITRIKSFRNDWFLDSTANIDWFSILSSRSSEGTARKQIRSTVLNTDGIVKLNNLSIEINRETRLAQISITYTDIYGIENEIEASV